MKNKLIVAGLLLLIAAAGVKMGWDAWLPKWRIRRAAGQAVAHTQASLGEGAAPKNIWKAGRYKKSDLTFTPTSWDFQSASGTVDTGVRPPHEYLTFGFHGMLAKPGATTADVKAVLYKSASQAGPFYQANAMARPQQRIGPEIGFGIGDDQRASLGGNWVYYKLVLLDATDGLIADFPPVRFPLIPPPKVSASRLEWKPNDPAGEIPEGSLKVLWTWNHVCIQRAPLAASVSVPLPTQVPVTSVAVDTVWPSRFDAATGAWRYTFAENRYAFGCRSAAPTPAHDPALVQPVMSLSGRAPSYFHFHPKPDAFADVRYYWEDDPGVSLVDWPPMPPVRSVRRLIVEFHLRGSNQKGRATCMVLPNPGPGTVMEGNRKITVTFSRPDLTAFWNALVRPPGRLVLARPSFGEIARSNGPVEALTDTAVQNGQRAQYFTEFRDCYTTGTAWAAEPGEFPVLAPVDGSLVERAQGRSADALSATLNIAVLPSELCFEKTEYPAIYSLNRVIRALLADSRVQLLNRSALDEMLDELARAAAGTGKLELRLPKAQYVLRFTDFTRLEGNGIALWLTDLSGSAYKRTSVRIGELMWPVKGDLATAVDTAFVQPLAEFLKPRLASFEAPEAAAVDAKTLIFGTLLPAAQEIWFQESDAMADDFAVTTAQALPQKRILARRELSALLKERGLRQGQGGGQDDLATGQVLVSGRIWWASPEHIGYFLVATTLADGRIVDIFFVPQETDASRPAMAAWCAQIRASPPATASTPTAYAGTELRYDPLNPYWQAPGPSYKAASQLSLARTGAEGAIELTLTQAGDLWKSGDKKGAMAKMEELWFRREGYALADAKIAAALLKAGATLAQWYHEQGEFASEADVWKWGLAKDLHADPALSVAEMKNRYMRALLLARDKPAKTAPPATATGAANPVRHAPGVSDYAVRMPTNAGMVYDGLPQVFEILPDGTEREVKLPYVAIGLPLPSRLNPEARTGNTQRQRDDPLYAIRPAIGPEAPLLLPGYVDAFLDYLRRDKQSFGKAIEAVEAIRREQQKAGKKGLHAGCLGNIRGKYAGNLLFAGQMGEPALEYYEMTAQSFVGWLRQAPYAVSEVFRKLPDGERSRLLAKMVDATGVGRGTTNRRFLETVDGGTFLVAKWGADSGDRVAAQTCTDIRAWAKAQLQSGDSATTGNRNSDYVYILLLADDPAVRDWLRVEKNLAATIARTWHGNDLVRYLLDHGYPNAMSVALTHRPVEGFSMLTFLWRSRQELEDSLRRDATPYSAAELRRLMGVLGRPDDEIEQAAARAKEQFRKL